MPPKKNAFTNSINPELYARSQQPASTVAMGMKNSQISSLSWANQVRREEDIRDTWTAKYDPTDRQSEQATLALERTQARDAARHDAYVNPATNPEIHSLLYKRAPPTAAATGADAEPNTGTQAVAATAAATTKTPSPSSSSPEAAPVVQQASNPRVKRAAAAYLNARCDHHTLQQRFPEGPATAGQEVGWGAATAAASGQSSAITARAAPHRRPAGAYRKPEDDDHADLLGFEYKPK